MVERENMHEHLHILPADFYAQSSVQVASQLIGCVIGTRKQGFITSGRITETEAYPSYDVASHAFGNKRTPRTEIQYSRGGRLYVYQIMGLHLMTSIVVGEEGNADVVFIRSIEPLKGLEEMRQRRGYKGEDKTKLASGPGMLSIALGITKSDNGIAVYDRYSEIRVYKDDKYVGEIGVGVRINLGVHGKDKEEARLAAERQWRFYDKNSKFISK